jgi:integrase
MKLPVRNDYVFVVAEKESSHREYYLEPFKFRRAFMERVCRKINIVPFGYHAIRHFTASQLYAKGYPISIIQAILRHSNPNTTARYLRNLGLDPAIKEALEEGVTRPAKIISLDQRIAVDGKSG